MPEINYYQLLKKYIRHVGEMEGVDFINERYFDKSFSESEKEELCRLSDQVWEENYEP